MANAPPQAAIALPPAIKFTTVRLETKPSAELACTQVEGSGDTRYSSIFVVFLNGLIAPQSLWLPVMALMLRRLKLRPAANNSTGPPRPQMLAYDRYGQGKSVGRDPGDEDREPGYGHGPLDVVRDLHQLIGQTAQRGAGDVALPRLLFVANSIGCVLARLYAQRYPGTVAGMLLLDSMMANTDFVSIFPDPDSEGFDPDTLPSGVTSDMLRKTRETFRRVFHPDVQNPEGLDRRNLAQLLPRADRPVLDRGYAGQSPYVTVVGHDPDKFARESLEGSMETPLVISEHYTNPAWRDYNEGLMKITKLDRAKGPVIAKDCGHFVQRDDPVFVANLACDMVDTLAGEV
ncbi:Alpha/Beta hydrolase protein [Xylariaceae sp. FL0016]|nr:Alpha/Beta hydrolase protein [Xylariaceae sp. FL0016]